MSTPDKTGAGLFSDLPPASTPNQSNSEAPVTNDPFAVVVPVPDAPAVAGSVVLDD